MPLILPNNGNHTLRSTLRSSSQKRKKTVENVVEQLDLSGQEALVAIDAKQLPSTLKELKATGCSISEFPKSLYHLQSLEKVYLGANRITNIEGISSCPSLLHAGLAFNRITQLPSCNLSAPNLLSLDLSHNDMLNLDGTITLLKALPQLVCLSLSGNPFCLKPGYQTQVTAKLPALQYLDGKKLDKLSSSRPGSMVSGVVASNLPSFLRLEMTEIKVLENVFAEEEVQYAQWHKQWQAAADAGNVEAAAAVPHPSQFPPLQATEYHVQLSDWHRTMYASVPLFVPPPEAPFREELDPKKKKKDDKAAAAAKKPVSAKKAAKGAPPPGLEEVKKLPRGTLNCSLCIPADTATRNWLRNGIHMQLVRTTRTAVPKPPDPNPPPPDPKAKKSDPPPPPQYDITSETVLLAEGIMKKSMELVDGYTHVTTETVNMVPVKKLWAADGTRMGLDDERHVTGPVAEVHMRLQLHAPAPEWPSLM